MLQQTQTTRVLGPWRAFLDRFPTPETCARAPLDEVLRLWTGLGYPRRARNLWCCAREITEHFDGRVPESSDALRSLPGIGAYTAAAVRSFAFDQRIAVLDTNVGRVLARCVANRRLSSAEATVLAHELLPRNEVATFNQAMLDLGAQFCRARPRCDDCLLVRVCRWRREGGEDPAPRSAGVSRAQTPFVGSRRQLRGQLLKALRDQPSSLTTLRRRVDDSFVLDVRRVLDELAHEGLIERRGARWQLAQH